MARLVLADGGVIRLQQPAGPFLITVFSSPTPLRAGTVDLSVLVQEPATHGPILDATVTLALRFLGEGTTSFSAAATRTQATNKLLYVALVDLPSPGEWSLTVTVRRDGRGAEATTVLDVDAPPPPILALWPYFLLPPAAVALFVLHQWLRARTAAR
jgi:hypothetical protein